MDNWIQYVYRDYLKPLIGLMKKQLLRENIFHADETPVHVLKEDGRMDNIIQSSRLFKAINYCLSHRNELMNYLRDGDCSISNNLTERSSVHSPSVEKTGYFPALRLMPRPVPQHTV